MAFSVKQPGEETLHGVNPEDGRLLLGLQQQMAAAAAQQQQASSLMSAQQSSLEARAPTPRMQGGTATPAQMTAAPGGQQQSLMNPYLFGVAAAHALPLAQQYPSMTGNNSSLLPVLAAAAAARNGSLQQSAPSLQAQILMNPAAAQALALQQYAAGGGNSLLANSVTASLGGSAGISQTALALYYQQLLQQSSYQQQQQQLLQQALVQQQQQQQLQQHAGSPALSPATAGFRAQQQGSAAIRTSLPSSSGEHHRTLLTGVHQQHAAVSRRQSAPILPDHLGSQSGRSAAGGSVVLPTIPSHHAPVERTASNGDIKPKLSSPEAVKEHISRLISENEAILDPPPVLMKRRTYHRHASGSIQSSSGESSAPGGEEGQQAPLESPSSQASGQQAKAARSQSLLPEFGKADLLSHQSMMNNLLLRQQQHLAGQRASSLPSLQAGGSIPVGALTGISGLITAAEQLGSTGVNAAVIQGSTGHTQVQCKFCSVVFINESSLKAHAFRCNKKPENGSSSSFYASPTESSCSSSAQISPTLTQAALAHSPGQAHQVTSGSVSAGSSLSADYGKFNGTQNLEAHLHNPSLGSSGGSGRSTSSPLVENKHPLKKRMLAEAEKLRSEEEEERKIKVARYSLDQTDLFLNDGEKAALGLLQLRDRRALENSLAQFSASQAAQSGGAISGQSGLLAHSGQLSTPQVAQSAVKIAVPRAVRAGAVGQQPITVQPHHHTAGGELVTNQHSPTASAVPAAVKRQQFQKMRNQPPVAASQVATGGQPAQIGNCGKTLASLREIAAMGPVIQQMGHGAGYVILPQPMGVLPQVSLSAAERDQQFKPYCITVQVPGAQSFEAPQSGRRPRHVTSPTFVCLKRPQPMFLLQKDSKLSMYKNWQQLPVNPAEAKLNLLLMGGCSLKRRLGASAFWRYTEALDEMGVLRVTHSSFWQLSQQAASAKAAAAAIGQKEEPMMVSDVIMEPRDKIGGSSLAEKKSGEKSAGNSNLEPSAKSEGLEGKSHLETKGMKKEISTQTTGTVRQKLISPVRTGGVLAGNLKDEKLSSSSNEVVDEKTVVKVENKLSRSSRLTKELLKGALANREHNQRKPKWKLVCNGGYSTDEGYTYVRGRGRGRYVCATCGIRCRKPSMLKKHIRTHQNVRPYACDQCSFSFKTKGNLTKHLKSKAHSKKLGGREGPRSALGEGNEREEQTEKWENSSILGSQSDSEDDRLEIDSNAGSEPETETGLSDFDEEDLDSDEESEFGSDRNRTEQRIWHKKLLPHRTVHTPPPQGFNSSLCWRLHEELRDCISAPPDIGDDEVLYSDGKPSSSSITYNGAARSPLLEGTPSSASAVTPKRSFSGENSKSNVSGSILAAIDLPTTVANLSDRSESSTKIDNRSATEMSPFLKSVEDRQKCELCGKEFRKIAELRLHMNVHAFGESNKRYQYVCVVCKSTVRSKALLAKHMSTAHPNLAPTKNEPVFGAGNGGNSEPETTPVKVRSTSESISELGTVVGKLDASFESPTELKPIAELSLKPSLGQGRNRFANNPRPFECLDCGTAFRIHGHLAKHLRCKIHVMKLECQGKLPIGTYAKIEEMGVSLNEVDTTDCDRSLKSLQKIAERIIPPDEVVNATANDATKVQNSASLLPELAASRSGLEPVKAEVRSPCGKQPVLAGNSIGTPKVSLMCTEELRPSPPPSSEKKLQAEIAENEISGRKTPNLTIGKSGKIVANVWCPPTAAEIATENHLTVPSSSGHHGAGNGNRQRSSDESSTRSSSMDRQDSESTERSGSFNRASFEGRLVDSSTEVDSGLGSGKSSIEQQSAKCKFCETEYPTEADLNIHLHADHILMRDGNDFKCPRANCDLVFPNKESLRQHIATHFLGGGGHVSVGSPAEQTDRDGNVSCETMAALRGKLAGGSAPAGSQSIQALSAGTANGNTSPGTPEESQTSFVQTGRSIPKKMKTHLVKLNSIPESIGGHLPVMNGQNGGNSQDFKSPSSMDNSPMSEDGASRESSSHSASPVLHTQPHGQLVNGGPAANFGRPLLKRKSVEESMLGSPLVPPNHLALPAKNLLSPDAGGTRRCSSAVEHSRTLTPTFGSSAKRVAGNYVSMPSVPGLLQKQQLDSPTQSMVGLGNLGGLASSIGQGLGVAPGAASLAWLSQGLTPQQVAMLYAQNPLNGYYAGSAGNPSQAVPKFGQFLSPFYAGMNGSYPAVSSAAAQMSLGSPGGRLSPSNQPAAAAPLNCALCQKECPNALALQEHLLTHVCERPYICKHCDAGFTSHQQLEAHLVSHQKKVSG